MSKIIFPLLILLSLIMLVLLFMIVLSGIALLLFAGKGENVGQQEAKKREP